MPPKRVKKVMTLPINVIFSHLQVRGDLVWSLFIVCCCIQSLIFYLFCSLRCVSVYVRALHIQKKTRVRIWLYEDSKTQLEGQIIGFDEYMNMVLDDAVEIGKKRTEIGRILVKGDSITLLQEAQPQPKPVAAEG